MSELTFESNPEKAASDFTKHGVTLKRRRPRSSIRRPQAGMTKRTPRPATSASSTSATPPRNASSLWFIMRKAHSSHSAPSPQPRPNEPSMKKPETSTPSHPAVTPRQIRQPAQAGNEPHHSRPHADAVFSRFRVGKPRPFTPFSRLMIRLSPPPSPSVPAVARPHPRLRNSIPALAPVPQTASR